MGFWKIVSTTDLKDKNVLDFGFSLHRVDPNIVDKVINKNNVIIVISMDKNSMHQKT